MTSRDERTLNTRCESLVAYFDRATLKHSLGLDLRYGDDGRALLVMPFSPEFCHAMGDTHGGILSTLLDTAGWFTAAPHYETWIATTDLQLKLVSPANQETLITRGRLLKAGRSLAACTMETHSASGRLVAMGSASFIVTKRRFEAQG